MIALDYGLVIDRDDPDQVAWAQTKLAEREGKTRELWRWLLQQQKGREWVSDVLLVALGPGHHIGGGSVEQLYGEVALHNLALVWLGKYVLPHRGLYIEMQGEALKREEQDRKDLDAMRAEWRRRRATPVLGTEESTNE